jgi:hypothetical protein
MRGTLDVEGLDSRAMCLLGHMFTSWVAAMENNAMSMSADIIGYRPYHLLSHILL